MRKALLRWYDGNRRDLPWRRTRDPYAIWVSEIMLQQTRVAAVVDHYQRFMRQFPTIVCLALAGEDEVLALWSGLGYYRRARLLHRAAQTIVREHEGQIPQQAEALRAIPGIGAYTSAAIASIAFGQPVAAVDGNVERVLARLEALPAGQGASSWQALADTYLAVARPGDFNQAMMELGATVCTPKTPQCVQCPVVRWCATRGEHAVAARPAMRSVQTAYLLHTRGKGKAAAVLLRQRPADSAIMPAMWELPEILRPDEDDEPVMIVRHSITYTNYYVRIYAADPENIPAGVSCQAGNWHKLAAL